MGINYTYQKRPRSVFRNAAVWLMTIALILFVAVSVVIVTMGNLPTPPVLKPVSSSAEWYRIRDEQTQLLSTYGWADQANGVVHIPIDEAMRLTVERGLPVHQSSTQAQAGE